jgi:hypothetical protein
VNRHFIPLTLGFIFSLTFALDAWAETAAQTAGKWGLIGSWAVDCSIPRDNAHPLFSYEVTADDRMMLRRDFGTRKDEQEVSSAEIAGHGLLILRILFPAFKQIRENGMVMLPDGGVRPIFSRNDKGQYSIRNGRFVANGHPTVALHKCVPRA